MSQSVEKDHPFSLEFLKRDIFNTNAYFDKMGVEVFKCKSIFDYVTKKRAFSEAEIVKRYDTMKEEAMENPDTEQQRNVFLMYRVPRSLLNMSIDMINGKLEQLKEDMDS